MTHLAEDGTLWIIPEPDGRCELCGAVEETRPYGPGGVQVCFACGMKDEAETERQFAKLLRVGASGVPDGSPETE